MKNKEITISEIRVQLRRLIVRIDATSAEAVDLLHRIEARYGKGKPDINDPDFEIG
jgi:hypothetical protein